MGRRSRSRSASCSPSASRSRSSRHYKRPDRNDRSDRDDSRSTRRSERRSRSRSRSPRRDDRSRHRRRDSDDALAPAASASASVSAPKTTDENGEISMSIEETNRLRISLGLKPLSLEPKKDKNVVNLQKSSAQVAEENDRAAIQKALEASRKKRELTQKLVGKSIGEQLRESSAASALDWVKKSRQSAVVVDASKAKQTKKSGETTEGDEYDASALAGMTVAHDLNAFDEGDEVVLTLKDSRVLNDDGNDVNDDGDELINVELSERDRREARQKQVLRARQPVYSGVDDDEFIQMGGAGFKKKKKGTNVLAQYDEDEDKKRDEESRKFTLDAHGSIAKAAIAAASNESKHEEEDEVAVVSLSMNRSKTLDDFYTAEEMDAQFAKKNKKLRKKKKKLRKKVQDDDDEAEGEGDAASLMAQLEEEAQLQQASGSSDRGRRRRPADDDDDDVETQNLRRFQEAREKASAVAQEALAASTGNGPVKRKKRRMDIEDDVDLELSATLARARQLAQLKQQEASATSSLSTASNGSVLSSEDKIAALVSRAVGSMDTDGDEDMSGGGGGVGNVFGEAPQDAESKGNVVVFNDATDFETRLRSAMEQRTSQIQASVAAAAAAKTASSKERQATDEGEDMEIDSDKEEDKSESKTEGDEGDEEEKEGWADDQPLVGMGMGATLALLKRTGDLRETRVERQAGRANDARDRNVDEELRVKDGVKLDYRDEFGRLLTKKEAFRLLSYKFHGHKPGKKKQEKRLKQLKEELESQKLLSGEGSSKMMKVLEKKQGQAKQAYVVLSNGN